MEEDNIKDLINEIFKDKYDIIKSKITYLTKPGDNNLSVLYKVDLVLQKDENSKEEKLNLVAKCAKTTNNFVKELFPVAFKNEINFYTSVVPTLQHFQKERGIVEVIDLFPKFYGAKLNKTGGDDVDENVVLILENLKCQNYQNIDRHLGFDLDGAKFILKDLATLHATALGLKLSKTNEFEENIKKYCQKAIPSASNEDENCYRQPLSVLFDILEDYEGCRPYIPKLKKTFSKMREVVNEFFEKSAREPLATLVHCDMWVNNTMQLIENEKLIKNKFVDFQLFFYQSPVADVLFFLWSSVQLEVLKTSLDNLLEYYQHEFKECLRKLNCNSYLFICEELREELNAVAPTNFMDIVYMTMFVVFGKKDPEEADNIAGTKVLKEDVPQVARNKIAYMVQEYAKRGWLEKPAPAFS